MADEYRSEIARIRDTFLGVQDHGIWTAVATVEYESGGTQGIGGYALDQPIRDDSNEFVGRFGTADGMEFIRLFTAACGVDSWEKVKGRTIRVLFAHGDSGLAQKPLGVAPGPFAKGPTFMFGDHMEADQKALEARPVKVTS